MLHTVGVIILGANTLYVDFCLFKEIPMASKGFRCVYKSGDSINEREIIKFEEGLNIAK